MRISGVGVLLVVVLAGCSGVTNTPAESPPAVSESASVAPSPSESVSEEAEPSELTKPFGSTFTWDDGVAITVSKPKAYKPDEFAAIIDDSKSFVIVSVTVKNGSEEAVESISLNLRATTGEREAGSVFDDTSTLPTVKVLPGKSLKWSQAFGVDKGAPFVLTVDYGFGNATGIYQ